MVILMAQAVGMGGGGAAAPTTTAATLPSLGAGQ